VSQEFPEVGRYKGLEVAANWAVEWVVVEWVVVEWVVSEQASGEPEGLDR
jgi:hypothetical protein